MFGISNSIINAPYSGFNNLKVYDVVDGEYSEFFSMTEQEVENIVNFLFPKIHPELKEIIIGNITEWYDGYYGDGSFKFYSTFSVGLYLNECYRIYHKSNISFKDKNDTWIPKPKREWAQSRAKIF
jgi:hypothetical protein